MSKTEKLSAGLSSLLGARSEVQSKLSPDGRSVEEVQANEEESSTQPVEPDDIINTIEDEELSNALRKRRLSNVGRPRKSEKDRVVNGEKYTRFTTIVSREQIAKLKEISFRETLTLKEILEQIFGDAIEAYEKKNGALNTKPHRGDPKRIFSK